MNQLQVFFDDFCALDPFQLYFTPGYETEMALLTLADDIHLTVHKGQTCLLLLLDLSAVFDTVHNDIFLRCLEEK